MHRCFAFVLVLMASSALAQSYTPNAPSPGPDPIFLQQAINSLQVQRNEAMDKAAVADANHRMAAGEVERLKGQITVLTKELSEAKAAKPSPPVAAK